MWKSEKAASNSWDDSLRDLDVAASADAAYISPVTAGDLALPACVRSGSVNELLIPRGLVLKAGTVVETTLTAAPTSTKNKRKARDPEMLSSKKG